MIFGTKNDVAIAKKVVEKFDKKPTTTTFKVNHTTPAEMANMVCNLLMPATSGSGGSSSGGGGGGAAPAPAGAPTGGAAGIVTGFAADGGSGAIALNESTVACTVGGPMSGSNVESLGLQNLSVSYVTQLGTVSVIGGSEQQVEMIKEFINQNDKKQPQAYLEVSILELNEEGSKTFDNQWTMFSSFFSASFTGGGGTKSNPISPMFLSGDGYEFWDYSGDTPKKLYDVKKVPVR